MSQPLQGTIESRNALTAEQKEKKKLARSIVKAIHGGLEEAARKEADLSGRPYEKELLALDALLQGNFHVKQDLSIATESKAILHTESDNDGDIEFGQKINGEEQHLPKATEELSEDHDAAEKPPELHHIDKSAKANYSETANAKESIETQSIENHVKSSDITRLDHKIELAKSSNKFNEINGAASGRSGSSSQVNFQQTDYNTKLNGTQEPLTPPSSEKDLSAPFANGGIPWYLEPFDPVGTTVHDERWTGREVLRGMSEELSELDDEEVDGLMEAEKEKKKKAAKKKSVPDWQALSLPLRETRAQKSRKLAAGIP